MRLGNHRGIYSLPYWLSSGQYFSIFEYDSFAGIASGLIDPVGKGREGQGEQEGEDGTLHFAITRA